MIRAVSVTVSAAREARLAGVGRRRSPCVPPFKWEFSRCTACLTHGTSGSKTSDIDRLLSLDLHDDSLWWALISELTNYQQPLLPSLSCVSSVSCQDFTVATVAAYALTLCSIFCCCCSRRRLSTVAAVAAFVSLTLSPRTLFMCTSTHSWPHPCLSSLTLPSPSAVTHPHACSHSVSE